MSASYPDLLAGGDTVTGFVPFDLFAGDAPVVTEVFDIAGAAAYSQFEVVAINAAGDLVKYDPTADYIVDPDTTAGGSGLADLKYLASKPIAILAQAIDTTAGAGKIQVYTAGFFNHDALVWPAGINTLKLRKAAFAGTPIHVGAVERDTAA